MFLLRLDSTMDDFLSWDDDIDLDGLLGEYTDYDHDDAMNDSDEDFAVPHSTQSKPKVQDSKENSKGEEPKKAK